MSADRVYNFAAGPACLPDEVLHIAQKEMLNYKDSGRSVMELSHRSKLFEDIINQAENDLRTLLNIPQNYRVLFLQGGGTGLFAAVPLNLMATNQSADYIVTGNWSQKAAEEAARYGSVNIACTSQDKKYTYIPSESDWKITKESAYVYYCANETVYGVEFQEALDIESNYGVPVVCDMSSNFLSRPIDVSKYGIIYAGAQKNSGIAGVTIVIVREDLIKNKPLPITPTILDFKVFDESHSMYNTPPTWSIYIAGLVYKWLLQLGGLSEMERINKTKSQLIYDVIDHSNGFYRCPVDASCRSRMNVVFRLQDEKLESVFIREAAERKLVDLAGHRSVGGIRASLYNAVPLEGVQCLAQFMKDFQSKNQ